ncbi:hypothetical protein EDE08_103120 [Bradyrhizobium sp. R2.2-H]|jgi:hypothetical protein|nr:hypothetical protein EDE10_103119 [Bradyrhizobium sp. Y-H1]TCU77673.1 hypothetical protein EDE08_103120 [Bradyrhizobium sp. R2.2-H]
MARDCNLVWGMPPGPASKEARASYFDDNSIYGEITRAAALAPSPDAESLAPGVSRMSDPSFWSQYQSEIRKRTSIDDRIKPGTFDLSLAFLANSDAGADFRQFTIGALTYVTVVNLRQGGTDPEIRQQMLVAMMRNRDRLAAFTVNGQGSFEQPGKAKLPTGQFIEFIIRARTIPGCFDIWSDQLTVGSMVKTPSSPGKGRRCE